MIPFQKETHWIYKTAQVTRIGWFILHILFLVLFLPSIPLFWFALILLFAAFLIPQWSGREGGGILRYTVLEFIFSSLFLLIGCFLLGKYSSFLAFPSLCAGVYSKRGKERWLLWLGFSSVPFLTYLVIDIHQMGMGVIDGFFFFGIGIAIATVIEAEAKSQTLLEENRKQNQLLEEYAKQIEKVTLLEERNRLARELHDTVGHTYTSVIMGLDAATYLIVSSPQKAKEQIVRLSNVMRRSLDEVRDYIHQISPNEENANLPVQLQTIANEFALHTKTEIIFKSMGEKAIVSFRGTITLVRCLQESLTNAVRHGHAKKVTVSLFQEESSVVLTIRDNGIGMKEIKYGFGLKGMKERLELLQGQLIVESDQGKGTVVTCYLPIRLNVLSGELENNDKGVDCG